MPGDGNSMEDRRQGLRKTNVECRVATAKSKADCKKQKALQAVTLNNIRMGEKLCVDYDLKFSFQYYSIRNL